MTEARPTAIVFGAERSGSTSLHTALGQHPEIFASIQKEINWHLRCSHGRMPCWASPKVRAATPVTYHDYAAKWRAGLGHKVRLESSPMYLRDPSVAERIVLQYLTIDLIAVLRHPADQAWSLYLTQTDAATFDSFKAELASTDFFPYSPWKLREFGLYARHLAPWYEAAEGCRNAVERSHGRQDAARIKVVLFDDLVSHPESTIADLFEFLGVDPSVRVEFKHLNQAGPAKIGLLKRLLDDSAGVKRFARRCLPAAMVRRLTAAHHKVRGANLRPAKGLPPDLRAELTERYYREDLLALENLLVRDLSRWLARPKPKVRRAQHREKAFA